MRTYTDALPLFQHAPTLNKKKKKSLLMSKRKTEIHNVFTCASLREKEYHAPKVESNQQRKLELQKLLKVTVTEYLLGS